MDPVSHSLNSVSVFLPTIIITPARLLSELRKGSSSVDFFLSRMQKVLTCLSSHNLPQFLPLFFLPAQLNGLQEMILRAVVAFPC